MRLREGQVAGAAEAKVERADGQPHLRVRRRARAQRIGLLGIHAVVHDVHDAAAWPLQRSQRTQHVGRAVVVDDDDVAGVLGERHALSQ